MAGMARSSSVRQTVRFTRSASDGTLLWRNTGVGRMVSGSLLLPDGRLILRTSSGSLVAMRTTRAPAELHWPTLHANAQRTGRAQQWLSLQGDNGVQQFHAGESLTVLPEWSLVGHAIIRAELVAGANVVAVCTNEPFELDVDKRLGRKQPSFCQGCGQHRLHLPLRRLDAGRCPVSLRFSNRVTNQMRLSVQSCRAVPIRSRARRTSWNGNLCPCNPRMTTTNSSGFLRMRLVFQVSASSVSVYRADRYLGFGRILHSPSAPQAIKTLHASPISRVRMDSRSTSARVGAWCLGKAPAMSGGGS